MKKTITVFLILTLIAALLAGCGQTTSVADTAKDSAKPAAAATLAAPKENAGTPSAKEDHGTLKVSFPAGAVRVSTNILALELGYFDEEGVTVEPINLGGLDALTAINSNGDQLDILNTGFVNDIQSIGGGYDLTFIAGTAVEGGAVIAKKGEADKFKDADTIIDIEAVKNAKLGFVRNEAAWVITRQYLLDNGVPESDIAAIEAETTDSVWGSKRLAPQTNSPTNAVSPIIVPNTTGSFILIFCATHTHKSPARVAAYVAIKIGRKTSAGFAAPNCAR